MAITWHSGWESMVKQKKNIGEKEICHNREVIALASCFEKILYLIVKVYFNYVLLTDCCFLSLDFTSLHSFFSFYVKWSDCVAKEASTCKSRDLMLTGWMNDRCMEQKIWNVFIIYRCLQYIAFTQHSFFHVVHQIIIKYCLYIY